MGGFPAPFITLGICLFLCAALTNITLPSLADYQKTEPNTGKNYLENGVICVLEHFSNIKWTKDKQMEVKYLWSNLRNHNYNNIAFKNQH